MDEDQDYTPNSASSEGDEYPRAQPQNFGAGQLPNLPSAAGVPNLSKGLSMSSEEGEETDQTTAISAIERVQKLKNVASSATSIFNPGTLIAIVVIVLVAAFVVAGHGVEQTIGQNQNACTTAADCANQSGNCATPAVSGTTGGVDTGGLDPAKGKIVAQAAYAAGFRGDTLIEMVAIAYAESTWNPSAGPNAFGYSGLWQVPASGHPNWQDPATNAKYALKFWQERANNPHFYPNVTITDPASGSTLPAPDFVKMIQAGQLPVYSGPGDQGYLRSTPYGPWYDFGPSEGVSVDSQIPANSWKPGPVALSYQKALALTNANIGSWQPGWNAGKTAGSKGSAASTASTQCSQAGGSTGIIAFAEKDYNTTTYSQCRPGCADISGKFSCQNAYHPGCEHNTTNSQGQDCSGFTRWVYWNAVGIDVGSNSTSQLSNALSHPDKWTVQKTNNLVSDWKSLNPQIGDIFVYGDSSSYTSHVAIYYGNGKVIEDGGGGTKLANGQSGSTGDITNIYNQDSTQWILHYKG